jgi:hypothetical protein
MDIGDALAPIWTIGSAFAPIDKHDVYEDTSYGHLIAMESAHGVLRLTMACALRFDNIVCFSSGVRLILRACWLAFLCSIGNCCLEDLLCVLMESLSSAVNELANCFYKKGRF